VACVRSYSRRRKVTEETVWRSINLSADRFAIGAVSPSAVRPLSREKKNVSNNRIIEPREKIPIILMMQQIVFCIQPKILDPLTKSFFPCAHIATQIAENLRKSTVIKFDKNYNYLRLYTERKVFSICDYNYIVK